MHRSQTESRRQRTPLEQAAGKPLSCARGRLATSYNRPAVIRCHRPASAHTNTRPVGRTTQLLIVLAPHRPAVTPLTPAICLPQTPTHRTQPALQPLPQPTNVNAQQVTGGRRTPLVVGLSNFHDPDPQLPLSFGCAYPSSPPNKTLTHSNGLPPPVPVTAIPSPHLMDNPTPVLSRLLQLQPTRLLLPPTSIHPPTPTAPAPPPAHSCSTC